MFKENWTLDGNIQITMIVDELDVWGSSCPTKSSAAGSPSDLHHCMLGTHSSCLSLTGVPLVHPQHLLQLVVFGGPCTNIVATADVAASFILPVPSRTFILQTGTTSLRWSPAGLIQITHADLGCGKKEPSVETCRACREQSRVTLVHSI